MPVTATTDSLPWAVVWSSLRTTSFAVYAGGAFVMESVWRGTQAELPQSQIAEACRWMGRRYRWVAGLALTGAALGGIGVAAAEGAHGPAGLAVWSGWFVLAALFMTITFLGHPALHRRSGAQHSAEQQAARRAAVARAIHRMDVLLRVDLVVAALTLFALAVATAEPAADKAGVQMPIHPAAAGPVVRP